MATYIAKIDDKHCWSLMDDIASKRRMENNAFWKLMRIEMEAQRKFQSDSQENESGDEDEEEDDGIFDVDEQDSEGNLEEHLIELYDDENDDEEEFSDSDSEFIP